MTRHRLLTPPVLAALALAACAAAALAVTGSLPLRSPRAAAAQTVFTSGAFTQSNSRDGAAILGASGMRPGEAASGEVTITNTGDLAGAFQLSESTVSEQPGAGGGRLPERLLLQILDVTNPAAPAQVWSGALAAFAGRDLGTFQPREARTYRMTATFQDGGPAADNAFAGASTSVRFIWTATADEPAAPAVAPQRTPKAPAKIRVLRAGVSGGVLDMLVEITGRAAVPGAKLALKYRSSGQTTKFSVPVTGAAQSAVPRAHTSEHRIKIRRRLPSGQRRKNTGIVELSYAGSDRVQPDSVRLRAATGKSKLTRRTAKIQNGRLIVTGTVSKSASGVVRIRLGYDRPDGTSAFLYWNVRISKGNWRLDRPLPATAAHGGQLSIQFTGYEPRNMRGEQTAKQVTG